MDKKPGSKSRALFAEEQAVVAPGQQRIALLSELALQSGRGATVTDLDGNTYLDFFAGVAVASLGHAHPDYVAAVDPYTLKPVEVITAPTVLAIAARVGTTRLIDNVVVNI